uniref:NADH-ubiquinone oxidoreductase chain 2 n=1 Tax=Ophiotreta sp. TaxID=3135526 RepID=A0AAU6PX77_9ECHI
MITIVYVLSLILAIFSLYFSTNWLILWFLVELGTLSLVVLLSESATPRGVESTTKYFVTQGVASVLLLFGIILNSILGGSLSLFSVYSLVPYYIILSSILIKLAVFPNPFWIIDVLSGVSLSRGIFVVLFSKLIPVYLYYLIGGPFSIVLIVVGLSSIIFGSILGINQTSVRKIVALSSISHMGWVVLSFPLLSGNLCLFIFLSYIMMVVPLLWISSSISLDHLIKGKNVYHNWGNVNIVCICLLSLGGLPPLLGFFYKWVMFIALVNSEQYLTIVFLVFLSLFSLFFYLQICHSLISIYWPEIKIMSFGTIGYIGSSFNLLNLCVIVYCILIVILGIWCIGILSGTWF